MPKKFPLEFKCDVVRVVRWGDPSLAEVAAEFDIGGVGCVARALSQKRNELYDCGDQKLRLEGRLQWHVLKIMAEHLRDAADLVEAQGEGEPCLNPVAEALRRHAGVLRANSR